MRFVYNPYIYTCIYMQCDMNCWLHFVHANIAIKFMCRCSALISELMGSRLIFVMAL